jgi:hypothetical protein
MIVIGISGKQGTGKSTLAEYLVEALGNGWEKLSFADVLKEEAAKKFKFPLKWAYEGKDTPVIVPDFIKFKTEHIPTPQRKMTVRHILQWYGTDVCRMRDPYYWARKMRHKLDAYSAKPLYKGVFIDDLRFNNELILVQEFGDLSIRVRPYVGWTPGPYADHISETDLDGKGFDVHLHPKFGELGTTKNVVLDIMKTKGLYNG